MRKIMILLLLSGFAFSIDGTIVFYDGTTLEGDVTSADTNSVLLIPNGLVLPEQISVVDIESLTLENGIVMVDDGVAKQTYQDGKFAAVEEDEPEFEEIDFEDEYEDVELTNLDYFSFYGFGGLPVYFRPSLQNEDGSNPVSLPNLGGGFSLPYFPIGPVNISLGVRVVTIGFDKNFGDDEISQKIKSITLAGIMNMDLQPIFSFLGENIHVGGEGGLTYAIGWQEEYSGGLGVVVGGNIDYWFTDLPFALRFFGNGYMIRQPNDNYTGFGNIGAALIVVLKRGE